jgi:transposase
MERLRPFFPKSRGRARVDDRRVLSGIIFINRNGLRWCDAPSEYGPPKTLYKRWKRWSDMGVFARILMGLAEQAPDNKTISIPSHRYCVSTAGQWTPPTSRHIVRRPACG